MAIRTNYTQTDFFNLYQNKINEGVDNKLTYWGNGSLIKAKGNAVTFFAENLQLQVNITYSSFRIKTAKGLHLDNRAGDFDTYRTAGTNAIAIQRFVGITGRTIDITIPANTVVTTEVDIFGNTISYELNSLLVLTSGQVSTTGLVTCTKEGTVGNVQSGMIVVLPTTIVGIESTYNIENISNGAEDENDQQFKTRIPNAVRGLQCANEFSIKDAVYALPEITFVDVDENSPTEGNFSVFVTTDTGYVDSITRARVSQALKGIKAYCVTYSIITPIISGVVVELDVEIDAENYQQNTLEQLIQITLLNYTNNKAISALTTSDINLITRRIDGVTNAKNILINGIASDIELEKTHVIKILDVSHITVNFV